MHNDLAAMYQALRHRQVPPEAILVLEGSLARTMVLGFFAAVHDEIVRRKVKNFFLYWTGHGFFTGETAQTARPGVALQASHEDLPAHPVFWDEIFEALAIPANVNAGFFPDH